MQTHLVGRDFRSKFNIEIQASADTRNLFILSPRLASLCFVAALVLSIALALALRLPGLDRRPMHNDEAVQAAKTGELF